MAELIDVITYLCLRYPNKHDLSNARLTKLIYLADWKSALDRGEQITDIQWVFDQFGPFVFDVKDVVVNDSAFVVQETTNMYGAPKTLIKLVEDRAYPSLSEQDQEILDWVIKTSSRMSWNSFIRLIYSTYPIMSQERGTKLDLAALAEEYKSEEFAEV
jgi:Protein of unknown function (DUF4065)